MINFRPCFLNNSVISLVRRVEFVFMNKNISSSIEIYLDFLPLEVIFRIRCQTAFIYKNTPKILHFGQFFNTLELEGGFEPTALGTDYVTDIYAVIKITNKD